MSARAWGLVIVAASFVVAGARLIVMAIEDWWEDRHA